MIPCCFQYPQVLCMYCIIKQESYKLHYEQIRQQEEANRRQRQEEQSQVAAEKQRIENFEKQRIEDDENQRI